MKKMCTECGKERLFCEEWASDWELVSEDMQICPQCVLAEKSETEREWCDTCNRDIGFCTCD